MTAFDDAWEVVKGDFYFDHRTPGSRGFKGKKIRGVPVQDLKGLRRAIESGHTWLNDRAINPRTGKKEKETYFDKLLAQAKSMNRRRNKNTGELENSSEFATIVPYWEKGKPTPKGYKPWRAVNLSEYGRKLPKGKDGNPRIGAIPSMGISGEEDLIDDIFDRDIHESIHEATEYALREAGAHPKNPVPFEIAAITGQTGRQNRKPGIIDRIMRRDPRKTAFNRAIERHRDTTGKNVAQRFAEAKRRRRR
tara:strand:- start:1614 stop:2363 length:750 start_codon:yes stop_codon:yes gene_type:complete